MTRLSMICEGFSHQAWQSLVFFFLDILGAIEQNFNNSVNQ